MPKPPNAVQGHGNNVKIKAGRSYGQIVRDNVFTFFNIVLFSLGAVLLLLGSPRDAFFTGAIAALNAVVATFQEVRAKRTLDKISLLTRPQATVIRGGQERQITPDEIVVGDLLVVAAGDQVLADGKVTAGQADFDESLLTGEADLVPKRPEEPLLSGSFVVSGKVTYEAEKVGADSFANKLTANAKSAHRAQTPLQSEVNLVVRLLLLVVFFFGAMIATQFFLTENDNLLESVRATSVVFGLAPSSLFLMIVVAYALGAVRIANQGALVQESNAVESLAHVDVLCLDKTGTLTANRIKLNTVQPLGEMTEAAARHALSVYAASTAAGNRTSEAIAAALPGAKQPVAAEAPFSSARKWSALAFDGEGSSQPGAGDVAPLKGVYVLGAPEMLLSHLPLDKKWQPTALAWTAKGERVLVFAYSEEIDQFAGGSDKPVLPARLTPIALISFTDELRPDAKETLAGFREAGIQIKIISGDNPQTVAALAQQAGLGTEDEPLSLLSGPELAAYDGSHFDTAVEQTDIFGRITPEQKQHIVRSLREQGHYVAMTGDGVNDVLALKEARLGIAMQSGSQATRAVAGIVLLQDSFAALPKAFLEGQRIMNSMGDVLRLYLVRIFTLAMLIGAIAMLEVGFPYTPAQNSIISIFSLTIPAFFLAIWAKPGATPHASIVRQLVNFVVPGTIVTGLFSIFIYVYFIYTTRDWHYTQLALTYSSIAMGLILVVFVQPPTKFWTGGDRLAADWRPTILAAGLFVLLIASPYLPILKGFFGLAPLTDWSLRRVTHIVIAVGALMDGD
ncbi:MAG: HAD-IC family P-type ATPase [Anaerolineales bacterium]|nr:HAD-IC family P-type ATPase [Anaerolineales bacterium]